MTYKRADGFWFFCGLLVFIAIFCIIKWQDNECAKKHGTLARGSFLFVCVKSIDAE